MKRIQRKEARSMELVSATWRLSCLRGFPVKIPSRPFFQRCQARIEHKQQAPENRFLRWQGLQAQEEKLVKRFHPTGFLRHSDNLYSGLNSE